MSFAFAICLSFWCAPICTAPPSLAFLLLLRSPPVLLPPPLLPPSSPSGSSSTSTTSSLVPGDDRVVLGRVVVDETLRLLWEGIRFVLVWDLELGLVKGKSERCDVSLLGGKMTFVKTKQHYCMVLHSIGCMTCKSISKYFNISRLH